MSSSTRIIHFPDRVLSSHEHLCVRNLAQLALVKFSINDGYIDMDRYRIRKKKIKKKGVTMTSLPRHEEDFTEE